MSAHDRSYYRMLTPQELVFNALDFGINGEMAIVLAEFLERELRDNHGDWEDLQGYFRFNIEEKV